MLNSTSLAPAVGVSARNVQFASGADNLPRKIAVIGTYLSTVADQPYNQPVLVLSPEDAGARAGFGSMLHRLVLQAFKGGMGVPVYMVPQLEAEASTAATGSVDFTASANVVAGTIHAYIAGIHVPVNVATGATAAAIATAVAAAITADKTLPVTAVAAAGVVDLTSKSAGPWGNDITIKFNLRDGQALPAGVSAAVTVMSGGTGIPNINDALNGLGIGDGANEAWFTDVVHGYGQDATVLDAISAYVGAGNDTVGLYSKTVSRPFRALTGDTAAGTAGLTALTTLADGRKLDRANGVIPVPGSATHPAEIAAQAIGHMARINQDRAAQSFLGIPLIDVDPGAKADRWTNDYDARDLAVKSGVGITRIQNGVVTLQALVTFYHSDTIAPSSNGYRSMRNISIIQNMLNAVRVNFEQERWQGISIVADTAAVSNITDRQKARDVDAVTDDLVALANAFASRAWVFDASYTVNALKQPGSVSVRSGGTGFDCILPVILSGEGGILDTEIQFDTSLAVLLN